MTREEMLTAAGHVLPALPTPGGNYVPAKTVGKLVYLSGVISTDDSGTITAPLVDIEWGYLAAQRCALTHLAILKQHLGSLDLVKSVVSLNGYVSAPAGFPDSPQVVNGASDLLVAVFG